MHGCYPIFQTDTCIKPTGNVLARFEKVRSWRVVPESETVRRPLSHPSRSFNPLVGAMSG
jgi:hypothetical protein